MHNIDDLVLETINPKAQANADLKEKFSPYQTVTDQIIRALENGVGLFENPWIKSGAPRNVVSKHSYKGINVLLVWSRMLDEDWEHPLFLTFNQIKSLQNEKRFQNEDISLRKGSKGTHVCFWNIIEKDTELDTGEIKKKKFPFLRLYTVFNIDQVECNDNVRDYFTQSVKQIPFENDKERNKTMDQFIANTGSVTKHKGDKACYVPSRDEIHMPKIQRFKSTDNYYATWFHEHIHWTGHTERCDRNLTSRFGDMSYAFEELIAEFGNAFLCSDFGIDGKMQHAEYIQSWIKCMKDDKYAIFTASSQAAKAVKFLHEKQTAEIKPKKKKKQTTSRKKKAA